MRASTLRRDAFRWTVWVCPYSDLCSFKRLRNLRSFLQHLEKQNRDACALKDWLALCMHIPFNGAIIKQFRKGPASDSATSEDGDAASAPLHKLGGLHIEAGNASEVHAHAISLTCVFHL